MKNRTGAEIKAELFGDVEGVREVMNELAPGLNEVLDEALWDGIWARPGLALATRSLCTISALIAQERYDYAKAHMYGARNLGVTEVELSEVVVQLTMYAGLPVVHEGLRLVFEVYNDPNPGPEGAVPSSLRVDKD